MRIRQTAVAGTWYPGTAGALKKEVDGHLEAVADDAIGWAPRAIIAPHAGIMFSGPVAAHAYRAASRTDPEVIFLAGPSHYVSFEGVSVWPEGAFDSPLGQAPIDTQGAADVMQNGVARDLPSAHAREHSLEMQLPFICRLLPGVPIVPIVMADRSAPRSKHWLMRSPTRHRTGARSLSRAPIFRISSTPKPPRPWTAASRPSSIPLIPTACSHSSRTTRTTSADAMSPAAADRRSPSCWRRDSSARVRDGC